MGDESAVLSFPRRVELDAVTGLPQRKHLDQDLPALLRHLGPEGLPLSVVMADIDHFKKFNDKWGHDIGDKVLRHVASIIRKSVRYRGDAYRYGGEEITLLLPNTLSQEGLATAERICSLVYETPLLIQGMEPLGVTLSLGVASTEQVSGEEILVCADKALLRAKNQGRNQAVLFEQSKAPKGANIDVDVCFPAHSTVSAGEYVLLRRWFAHRNEPTNIEAREIFLPGSGIREISEVGCSRSSLVEAEIRGRVREVERRGSVTYFTFEVDGEVLDLMVHHMKGAEG
jgi:diguanylate cyclase (GGDEF)-like protein